MRARRDSRCPNPGATSQDHSIVTVCCSEVTRHANAHPPAKERRGTSDICDVRRAIVPAEKRTKGVLHGDRLSADHRAAARAGEDSPVKSQTNWLSSSRSSSGCTSSSIVAFLAAIVCGSPSCSPGRHRRASACSSPVSCAIVASDHRALRVGGAVSGLRPDPARDRDPGGYPAELNVWPESGEPPGHRAGADQCSASRSSLCSTS